MSTSFTQAPTIKTLGLVGSVCNLLSGLVLQAVWPNPTLEGTAGKQGLPAVPVGFAAGRPLSYDVGRHE